MNVILFNDSNLKAKYIRVTVNGNTENDWASISEIRAFSKPSSTDPSRSRYSPGPDPNPDNCLQDVLKIKLLE